MRLKLLLFFPVFLLFLISGCASNHVELLYNKKPAFYSYIFGNIKNNHVSAQHDADVYTAIASCQKTIFALLAYKTLGINYHYETKLYVTKKNNKVHDAIISFAGDPTLKTEDLLRLLSPINGAVITGKILLDASLFKTPFLSPNIMIDDIGTDYAQPVSSINLDKNLITVTARPNKPGKPALITNDYGYQIDSNVTTTPDPSSVKLSMHNNCIQINGNINFKDAPLELKISPVNFDYFILHKIENILNRANIKGTITIIRDKSQLPKKLILTNTIKSDNLSAIIPGALKKSENLVFDSLYLKIIHSQSTYDIKKWEDGDKIIKELIRKYFNVDMADSLFVDGSGLSRYNRIQPRKFFALLKQGYYINEFVTAMPSPGEPNSTLAKRTNLLKYIKAKTGNMSGISCLCGYSVTSHPKAFIIIANSFAPPSKEMFFVLDNFVNHYTKE